MLTKKSTQYRLKNSLVDADQYNLPDVSRKTSLVKVGRKIPSLSWPKNSLDQSQTKNLPNIDYKIVLANVG